MKLFQTVQSNLEVLGVDVDRQQSRWNKKEVLICAVYVLVVVSNGVHFFLEAESLQEYAISIYVTSGIAATLFIHVTVVFKKHDLFKLIDKFEHAFNESEQI